MFEFVMNKFSGVSSLCFTLQFELIWGKNNTLTLGSHTGKLRLHSSGCFNSTGFGHSLFREIVALSKKSTY